MDYALVTVRAEKMHWQADMELPARMKIKELAVRILETLKPYEEERFCHVSEISLFHEQKNCIRMLRWQIMGSGTAVSWISDIDTKEAKAGD